jgi:hypothetical protein
MGNKCVGHGVKTTSLPITVSATTALRRMTAAPVVCPPQLKYESKVMSTFARFPVVTLRRTGVTDWSAVSGDRASASVRCRSYAVSYL